MAKGSAAELRTQLYIATEIGELESVASQPLVEQTKKIGSQLQRLIQSLNLKPKT